MSQRFGGWSWNEDVNWGRCFSRIWWWWWWWWGVAMDGAKSRWFCWSSCSCTSEPETWRSRDSTHWDLLVASRNSQDGICWGCRRSSHSDVEDDDDHHSVLSFPRWRWGVSCWGSCRLRWCSGIALYPNCACCLELDRRKTPVLRYWWKPRRCPEERTVGGARTHSWVLSSWVDLVIHVLLPPAATAADIHSPPMIIRN